MSCGIAISRRVLQSAVVLQSADGVSQSAVVPQAADGVLNKLWYRNEWTGYNQIRRNQRTGCRNQLWYCNQRRGYRNQLWYTL